MYRSRPYEDHMRVLFRVKKGSVTAEIRGPRIGWQYRDVQYFRWQKSPKHPTKWIRVDPSRPTDQLHLEQCVKAVRTWLKAEDDSLAEIHHSP